MSKDFKAKIADLGQAKALELVGQLQLSYLVDQVILTILLLKQFNTSQSMMLK